MKKIVFLLFILTLIFIMFGKQKEILIPSEAIRIRIIANSNSISDQKIKSDIKKEVNNYLIDKMSNVFSYDEANKVLSESLPEINNIVGKHTENFNIYYGSNYFPSKEYKGFNYKEGNYQSLVISLGKAKGENFWCVLFPPLCLIDEENISDKTYELYVLKLLKNIK